MLLEEEAKYDFHIKLHKTNVRKTGRERSARENGELVMSLGT